RILLLLLQPLVNPSTPTTTRTHHRQNALLIKHRLQSPQAPLHLHKLDSGPRRQRRLQGLCQPLSRLGFQRDPGPAPISSRLQLPQHAHRKPKRKHKLKQNKHTHTHKIPFITLLLLHQLFILSSFLSFLNLLLPCSCPF
ncbi:hypothetical protein PSV08DRAFT_362711, partial [Bipolaris maydis]|uniref:uncharacterized protein n=1 Tax=Cochliobolus heterostrophus TaxID=5016 RepID=UPI0024D4313E